MKNGGLFTYMNYLQPELSHSSKTGKYLSGIREENWFSVNIIYYSVRYLTSSGVLHLTFRGLLFWQTAGLLRWDLIADTDIEPFIA